MIARHRACSVDRQRDERSNPSASSPYETGERADHFGFPSLFRFRGLGW
jgi:hypothetical protein